eukprot:s955_g16.t1
MNLNLETRRLQRDLCGCSLSWASYYRARSAFPKQIGCDDPSHDTAQGPQGRLPVQGSAALALLSPSLLSSACKEVERTGASKQVAVQAAPVFSTSRSGGCIN